MREFQQFLLKLRVIAPFQCISEPFLPFMLRSHFLFIGVPFPITATYINHHFLFLNNLQQAIPRPSPIIEAIPRAKTVLGVPPDPTDEMAMIRVVHSPSNPP